MSKFEKGELVLLGGTQVVMIRHVLRDLYGVPQYSVEWNDVHGHWGAILPEHVLRHDDSRPVDKPEDSDFKPGDVVFLKSGSPPMTVTDVKGNIVLVNWFCEGRGEFKAEEVTKPVLVKRGDQA